MQDDSHFEDLTAGCGVYSNIVGQINVVWSPLNHDDSYLRLGSFLSLPTVLDRLEWW
jgi:hypothetical protein